jgi:hypothetical protein
MIEHGLARRTINQHVGRIKRLFKWAVAQELIELRISQALSSWQLDPIGAISSTLCIGLWKTTL